MAAPDPAVAGADAVPAGSALGMLETLGLVAAVEAADAMLKASEVRLVRQERTVPGLVTHFVVGETAAVRSAVDAGAAAAARVGRVAASHVIPRPDDGVWRMLAAGRPPRPAGGRAESDAPSGSASPTADTAGGAAGAGAGADAADDYDGRTVRELRQLARDRDDPRLQGRAVSRASKDRLVAFLRETDGEAGGEA